MGDNEETVSGSVLAKDHGGNGRNGRTHSRASGTPSGGEIKRNAKGQFVGGSPLTPEFKALIREGQIDRYERVKAEQAGREPELKRCTKCGLWKDRKDDFSQCKRKLASGTIAKYPSAECKECRAEISAAWRASKSKEEHKKLNRKYAKSRNRNKRKRYNREYGRFRRLMDGAKPRGPWSKYKNEFEADELVPRAPFDDALSRVNLTIPELVELTGYDEALFRRKNKKYILLGTVDEVFTKLGIHDQVVVQYPSD